MLSALPESPVVLTKTNIQRMSELFPVPIEQRILWADAEFDLRPSGIVCTDVGMFIKTNAGVWEKKSQRGKKTEPPKSILFYYRWEDFDPAWFISDNPKENRVLMVEKQCTEHFIEGCRALATQATEQELEFSSAAYSMTDGEIETLLAKTVPTGVAALQSAQSAVFVEQKASVNTSAGHGEMAEEAITLADRFLGLDATVVGRDNAKDGADRIVNEVFIQTKYYNSARGSLEACFRPEDGMYRYMKDGKPMQLEVPKDQYERVLQGFERKIEQGKVRGVTDPKEARQIVRKGRLTYNQAVNLTKSGTIESLTYDAMTGAVMCSCTFGITFVATVFLTWRKTGDIKQAVKAGMSAGVQVFGISFVQHMLVSQIARKGLANALLVPSQYVVGRLGYQASTTIVNGIRALSGKGAIYGAAGTAVAHGVGTAVGIAGGFVGGVVGVKAVNVVGDTLHEDDIEILGRLFNSVVSCMIGEYLLDAKEMDDLMRTLDKIPQKDFKSVFCNIIKADEQESIIRGFLRPHFEEIAATRELFALPSEETIWESLMEECVC